MEPALPLPLRLDLSHAAIPTDHATVSDQIAQFLSSYAARTGTSNAASSADEGAGASSSTTTATTGGVVASQLTRLINGLAGKIDYAAFESLLTGLTSSAAPAAATTDADEHADVDMDETPIEVLEPPASHQQQTPPPPPAQVQVAGDGDGKQSFSKADELVTAEPPTLDSSLIDDHDHPLVSASQTPSSSPKKNKDKKDKKEKREKKDKKLKKESLA